MIPVCCEDHRPVFLCLLLVRIPPSTIIIISSSGSSSIASLTRSLSLLLSWAVGSWEGIFRDHHAHLIHSKHNIIIIIILIITVISGDRPARARSAKNRRFFYRVVGSRRVHSCRVHNTNHSHTHQYTFYCVRKSVCGKYGQVSSGSYK